MEFNTPKRKLGLCTAIENIVPGSKNIANYYYCYIITLY